MRTTPAAEEANLIESVSAERLMESTRAIAQWVRLSGTPEEAQAFDWIERQLQSYGLETTRYSHPALVSWPESATLTVRSADGETHTFACATHAFATSTPPEGLSGELVYAGRGTEEELSAADARGKIVLIDGIIAPNRNLVVESAGVAGSIWIAGTRLHERALSPVWGTPTPETAGLLPKTPSISIAGAEGQRLKALMEQGPVNVTFTTKVYRGWRNIPLLIGDLRPGLQGPEADTFVMLSGHVDSWYYGAMDNGSANATMLEVSRILAEHRSSLRRGLRVAFWSGHSHARYAGSAWYADHAWQDLYDHCVAHVNVDSVGGKGATVLSEGNSMAELRGFASDVIEQIAGQRLSARRYGRSGDQSFWGHGIPAVFMSLSEQGPEAADPVLLALHQQISGGHSRSGGLGWWWHTPEDTVDKIDPDFLKRDATIYVLILNRLTTMPVLPFNYGAVIDDLGAVTRAIQEKAGEHLDLGPVTEQIAALRTAVDALDNELITLRASGNGPRQTAANRGLMRLGRNLIPVDYTNTGQFDHDLAVPTKPIPALQGAADLASLDPKSPEYQYRRTRLIRERNRVVFGLKEATRAANETLAALRQA